MTTSRRSSRSSRFLPGLTLAALTALGLGGCSIENPDFLGDDGASDTADTADATVDSGVTAEDGTGSADAGDGDGDGDGDSNSSSSSSGDGDLDCAPDAECRAVPDGWIGFFTVADLQDFDLDAPPECSDPLWNEPGWNATKYQLLADPLDADCACECEALLDETNGPACEEFGKTVTLDAFIDVATCQSGDGLPLFSAELVPGECNPIGLSDVGDAPEELSAIFDAGNPPLEWDCRPNDEVEFGQAQLMCRSTHATCEVSPGTEGTCIVSPETPEFMGRVCVYKAGASQTCPDGYDNPVITDLFPSGQLDVEGQDPLCTECGCTANEPAAPIWCQVEASLHADDQCQVEQFATGTCNEGDTCEIMQAGSGPVPMPEVGSVSVFPVVSPPLDADLDAATCGQTVGGETLQEGVPFGFNGEPITVCCDQP